MIAFILMLLTFAVLPAQEAGATGEQACREYFKNNQYQAAVECLNNLLYQTPAGNTDRLVELYEQLGVCYMMLDKRHLAKTAFDNLVDLKPDHEMDPNVYLPEIISIFQVSKMEKREELARLLEKRPKPYPAVVNFAPFGVPQMFNHQVKKGVAVGLLQAAALAVSIYAQQKRRALDDPQYRYPEDDVGRAQTYHTVQVTAFLAFTGIYFYGLADGFLNRPAQAAKWK